MLTANRTAAAAADAGVLVEAERHQQHPARQALERPRRQLRCRPRWLPRRGRRNTIRPARTARQRAAHLGRHRVHARRARAVRRRAEHDRREQHDDQQHQWRDRRHQQRVLVAVEEVDRREHDRAEDDQRDDVEQRLRDDRAEHDRQVLARAAGSARDDQRARRLAEAGRQRRGHQHADERPLSGVGQPDAGARQRGLQDRVPREGAHRHRAAHDVARPSSTNVGLAVISAVGDVGQRRSSAARGPRERCRRATRPRHRRAGRRRVPCCGAAVRSAPARGWAVAAPARAASGRPRARRSGPPPAGALPRGSGVAIASS